jgi:hypothetical protein
VGVRLHVVARIAAPANVSGLIELYLRAKSAASSPGRANHADD